MATTLSFESLYALLKQCGLIELDLLKRTIKELFAGGLDREDVNGLVAAFVQKGMLTRWQADKLLAGKHKGFFLGKYRLLDLLGTGGMSSVYLAEHTVMRRRVAIKVLPQAKVNDSSYLERFHREAQAAAALDHRNIVRAYDVDQEGNIHFLVMEYVVGTSLLDLVKQSGPLDAVTAMEYTRQAAIGLQHAHTVGMVHRDIKPGNLLIDQYGTVKILDMGLAMFYDAGDTNSLTRKHDETVLGTVDYLSPEQAIDSHNVDARSDLYCLGGTLYFALVGHPPFPDGTPAQRLLAHQQKSPTPIRKLRPDVPEEVAAIAEKMLQKRPEDRYESATAVATECLKWLKANGGSRWHELNPEEASRAMTDRGPLPATNAASTTGDATRADMDGAVSKTQPAIVAAPPALSSVEQPAVVPESVPAPAIPAVGVPPESDAAHIRSPESRPMVVARLIKRDAAKPAETAAKTVEPLEIKQTAPDSPAKTVRSPDAKPASPAAISAVVPTASITVAASSTQPEPTSNANSPLDIDAKPAVDLTPAAAATRTEGPTAIAELDDVVLSPADDVVLTVSRPGTMPPAERDLTSEFESVADDDGIQVPDHQPVTGIGSVVTAEENSEEVPEFSMPAFSPTASKSVARNPAVASKSAQPPGNVASNKSVMKRMLPAVIGGVALVGILVVALAMWPGKPPSDGKSGTGKASTGKANKKVASSNLKSGEKAAGNASGKEQSESSSNQTVVQNDGQKDGTNSGKNDSTKTAAVSPRSTTAGKPISVGDGGAFATLNDALASLRKKPASSAGSSLVRIELQPGLVIRERIVFDKSLPKRMQISAPAGEQVTVDVPGTDPCLEIIGGDGVTQRLRIEGLRFAGAVRPVTIRLSGQLDGLTLSRLSIDNFTAAGIEATGLVSYSKSLATIENCEFRGESTSTGMKFASIGDQSCAAVHIEACRFLGPMESGIWFAGPVTDFDLHRNIFVETATGLRFDAGTPVWKRVSLGRNTFFKNGVAVGFAKMPDEGTEGLMFTNNLFVQTNQLPIQVSSGLDVDRFRRTFISTAEYSVRNNWTDSPSPGEAASIPTLLDLFSTRTNRWGAENLGLDTDSNSSRFLQPAPDSPLLTSGDQGGNPFGTVIGAFP